MAKKQKQPKYKKFFGFIYIGLAAVLVYTLGVNALRVYKQKQEYNSLVAQRDSLLKEKEEISNEVKLLSDDDYVTRYARDHYIFSKDGEEVIKLPEK